MHNPVITAIILAGGLSTRMNGNNKGLQLLHNKPLYQHVIDRILPHVNQILINCNNQQTQYAESGYEIFSDDFSGYLGPLSGIYSGLMRSQTKWNLFVSCDTPFLPDDLITRLCSAITHQLAAYPYDGQYHHPTLLLIHKQACRKLEHYLQSGQRKLLHFLNQINAIPVDFSDESFAFQNINTVEDLRLINQS